MLHKKGKLGWGRGCIYAVEKREGTCWASLGWGRAEGQKKKEEKRTQHKGPTSWALRGFPLSKCRGLLLIVTGQSYCRPPCSLF